jgi:hypothetical protein
VPNHVAEASQSITVSAVKTADNSNSCTPAFASVSKSVLFTCSHGNPTAGLRPVRVNGNALNAGNNASAACDGTGQSLSLSFNASGVATVPVAYADVGQVSLDANYSSSGLTMTGTDTFVTWPHDFSLAVTSAAPRVAGAAFAGTITARNFAGVATPSFGKESSPEGVILNFARTRPSGTAAVNGGFSGSAGAFNNGSATLSNMIWSEVGRGNITAVLSSGNYLGAGATAATRPTVAGTSATTGWIDCAAENGTCALPSGAVATVAYGASGRYHYKSSQSGSISCNNANFTDPYVGAAKRCAYIVTSGANTAVNGEVGSFIPSYFDVTATEACNSAFTYSGQPFSVGITAKSALGGITQNYDGSSNTSPNYAQQVLLSTPSVSNGTLSNATVPVSGFIGGTATVLKTALNPVSYAFTAPPQSPTTVAVRAIEDVGSNAVSSSGHAEGSVLVRSGRLRFSNAYGSERASLNIPVQAQYWNGKTWVINNNDTGCTAIPAAAVALSSYKDYRGASTSTWLTTASSVNISGGIGTLTLSQPSLTGSATASDKPVGTVNLAFNLGDTSSTSDNACANTVHPATPGANLSWLRARWGSCAATATDPAARASFGVFSPETNKLIHVRELY